MDTESKGSQAADGTGLERAIVLQLLRDDHERVWSRAQLRGELESTTASLDQEAVERALWRLERDGVVGISEQGTWASSAIRCLDELGLIGV